MAGRLICTFASPLPHCHPPLPPPHTHTQHDGRGLGACDRGQGDTTRFLAPWTWRAVLPPALPAPPSQAACDLSQETRADFQKPREADEEIGNLC